LNDKDGLFTYESLDIEQRQIRLLQLTVSDSSRIGCVVRYFAFEEAVKLQYEALSYVWGPPEPSAEILINDKIFKIRQNLFDFFQRLQDNSANSGTIIPVTWLWIDQICINQTVISERNQQVAMMADIYKNASSVTVWLGDQNAKEARAAMSFLKALEDRGTDLSPFLWGGRGVNLRTTLNDLHRRAITKEHPGDRILKERGKTDLGIAVWLAMNTLLSNAYWSRLWIVQEILLARRITVQWCDMKVKWAALKTFVEYVPGWKGVAPGPAILKLSRYEWVSNNRRYDLPWMLQNFCAHDCEDPRDKVFGLLAVVKDTMAIDVDYSKTASEIFAIAALHLLRDIETKTPAFPGRPQQAKRWAHIMCKLRVTMLPEIPFDKNKLVDDMQQYREWLWQEWYSHPNVEDRASQAGLAIVREMFQIDQDPQG
jgi:hypothetical protein